MGVPNFPDPLKPKRTGTSFDFADVGPAEQETGYYHGPMNQEKLLNQILACLEANDTVLPDFYYKDYKSFSFRSSTKMVMTKSGGEFDFVPRIVQTNVKVPPSVLEGFQNTALISIDTRVNKKMGEDVEVNPKFRIIIDTSETYTEYVMNFTFPKGTPKHSDDITYGVNTLDEKFDVSTTDAGRIMAIEFKTQNPDHFILLNEKLKSPFRNLRGYILDKFLDAYRDLKDSDYAALNNYYTQTPLFILSKLDLDSLFDDLVDLLIYDIRTWFFDNSNVMIKAMTAIIGKDGGTKYLYDSFNSGPYIAKEIYYHLDNSGKSMPHGGVEVPHKTIFATMLWMIADDNNQWRDHPDRDQTHIRFSIMPGHKVDSNIWSSDTYEDKYNLTQVTQKSRTVTRNVGGYQDGSASADFQTYQEPYWSNGTTQYLHPLDMVTLIVEGPKGLPQELIVPAIFVKDLAHHREWKEVMAIIRMVVNIFIIIVSLVTLIFGNPGPLLIAISIIDLGLATADIAIQTFADEIRKLKGGQEFLDTWEAVYLIAGIATGLPLLGSLLRGGAKLLMKAMSVEARAQLLVMLKYALQSSKNIPKFVKGQFEIISNFSTILGLSAGLKMERLAKEGMMLIKGVQEGGGGTKYFLSFLDNFLEGGSIGRIKQQIDFILKRGTISLAKYLDEVLKVKLLRYVNTGGLRGEIALTAAQQAEITRYALKYGIDEAAISFTETANTGFKRFFGEHDWLQIGTDVMPGVNATAANGKLSWKSAIAHELEGHRAAELAGKTHGNPLYEEVQASMRASQHGKDLTAAERELLKQDAIERLALHEPSKSLDDIINQLWLEKY